MYIIIFIILIILFAVSYMLFRVACARQVMPEFLMPKNVHAEDMSIYEQSLSDGERWFLAQNPQEVTIKSDDGLTLYGYFLTCENAKRTVMCVHGYRGTGIKDFGCVAEYYHTHDCNLLLIDHRASGKSEGHYITYGSREKFDCLKWVSFLNSRVALPLYLDGISMGGATVLMMTGLALPANVCGVIADCAFTSAYGIMKPVLHKRFHLPEFPFLQIARIYAKLIAGFDLRATETIEVMRKCTIPVLFIHGDKDTFVPTEMSRINYEACAAPKKLLIVEGAGHALSYMINAKLCEDEISAFFERCENK